MALSRTRTSIANMAADQLSASTIGNIEEGVGDALVYWRNYDEAVETVCAEYPWNAGKSRAILQPISLVGQAPQHESGYSHAYALPVDCLRPITINDRPCDEVFWEVETIKQTDAFGNITARRRVLYCDTPAPLSLKYAAAPEPSDMSPHMALAVAIDLAMRCEGRVSNSTSRQESLKRKYQDATKGSGMRVGGWQVDSRSQNPKPQRKQPTAGARARAGQGM